MIWGSNVVVASSVAVTTAGDLRTSVCRVVIYLQRDMSGDSYLPQDHSADQAKLHAESHVQWKEGSVHR